MNEQESVFLDSINAEEGRILRICRNYSRNQAECDDLFQEVMYHLWKSFDSFRGESSRSTWIFRVTLYTCMDHHRKKKRQDEAIYTFAADQSQSEKDPEPLFQALHRAIQRLKEIDRAIMILYLEERTYAQIAEIIGISESNVGVRITRAKSKLKEIIDRNGNG